MKRKIYFIGAITFAILLPLIFGLIYFKDLYHNYNEKIDLAKLDIRPEILYESESIINNLEDVIIKDENYHMGNYYDFQVGYFDSVNLTYDYYLYLTEINFSDKIYPDNFKWRLFVLDKRSNEYRQLSSGNFGYGVSKFKISPNLTIGKNEIHNFRLYYYLTSNSNGSDYAGSTFKAKIKVE